MSPVPTKIDLKLIPLSKAGHYIKLDRTAGNYRVAYYWPKLEKGRPSNQLGEYRVAAEHPKLIQALCIVFGESEDVQKGFRCPFDPETVEMYIRAMPWGGDLP